MTREKKEILKKLEQAHKVLRAEEEMSCGFAPAGWFDKFIEENIFPLEQRLAELRGFNNPMDMEMAEEKILIDKGLFEKLWLE